MDMSLITVAFDPHTRAFPESPLEKISGEILSVVEHFFQVDGLPHLLLIVHHRKQVTANDRDRRNNKQKTHPADELAPEDRRIYDRLSDWRKGRAQADGVPVYVVLNNRDLAQLARRRPRSKTELTAINGVGEAKAGRYGADILKIIADSLKAEMSPTAPTTEGAAEHG